MNLKILKYLIVQITQISKRIANSSSKSNEVFGRITQSTYKKENNNCSSSSSDNES